MVIWLCCKIGMCWCEKQRQVAAAVQCLLSPSSPPKWEVLRWEWRPPSSCSPSDPNSQGTPSVCGNKLTGKVNIKVWKEPLPLVVSSVTEPRTGLTAALNHEWRNSNIGQQRWEIMMWELTWWCERMELLFACCHGDVWCIVTSRGGDHGEDITLTVHLYIAIKNYTACFCVLIYLYKTLQWPICFIFILLHTVFHN